MSSGTSQSGPPLGAEISVCRDGKIAYLPFDGPIGDAIHLYGEWAGLELEFLSAFLRPGAFVTDGGANIGAHTVAFARKVGPHGRVYAFEASPELCSLVKWNVDLNSLTNVVCLNSALGATNGSAHVPQLQLGLRQNAGALRVAFEAFQIPAEGSVSIPVVALDDLAIPRLDLLKLDIEGGEPAALQGASETIRRLRPVVFAEMLSIDIGIQLMDAMRTCGYHSYFCSFPAFNPHNYKGEQKNIFNAAHEPALLFLPSLQRPPVAPVGVVVKKVDTQKNLSRWFDEMPTYVPPKA